MVKDRGTMISPAVVMNRGKILLNRARCRKCGVVLISKHRWDYSSCACGNAVDGGRDYLKRAGNPEDLEEMSEWEEA